MSDEELYKHQQVDTRKLVANEPTLAPNLIDVLREDEALGFGGPD